MAKLSKVGAVGVALGTLAAVMIGSPALAEASWSSSISGAQNGFESRVWHDYNRDGVNGFVKFIDCGNANPDIAVYRADAGPDTQVARKVMQCSQGGEDWLYFGDVAAGDYHFTVKNKGTGASGLYVDFVAVIY